MPWVSDATATGRQPGFAGTCVDDCDPACLDAAGESRRRRLFAAPKEF